MPRSRRIAGIAFVSLALLLVIAYFGLRFYLNSNSVRELASAKLSEKLGGDVHVTELKSDWSSTTLMIEIPGGPNDPPLIRGRISVDVSPIGLASGTEPKSVDVGGAELFVRLDADGNIVTPLPKGPSGSGSGALPAIHIHDASIRIAQVGKPDFSLRGLDVVVEEVEERLKIQGSANDPTLGDWKCSGDWSSNGGSGAISLEAAKPVHWTPALLKSIPFVPSETWDNVEVDGNTPVKVVIGRTAEAKWTWNVECSPTGTRLKVFPIDLEVTETSGKIIVDGTKVTLTGVRGKAASGTITTDAILDFGQKPARLEFQLKATNLDVKQTPPTWGLAGRVDEGRLNGAGKIALILADGQVQPEGKAKAEIIGKLFGGVAEIKLYLRGDGKRLKFEDNPEPSEKQSLRLLDGAWLRVLLTTLLQPPAPSAANQPKAPQYVRANLKLRDVDLAELVAKGQLTSPVKLAGKMTLEINSEIPISDTGSLKLYRATGKLSSPSLQIENLTLMQVTADVQLKDGVLKLSQFAAEFPKSPTGKTGRFLGTATFGIEPRTDLVADLKLDEIPLGQVFAAFPGMSDKADGELSGQFQLKIPGDKISDPKSYEASGQLTSSGLTIFEQKASRVAVELLLKNGVAELKKAEIDLYDGTVLGEAKWPIVGRESGSYKLTFKNLDSAKVVQAIPESPVKLAGKFDGKLTGTLPTLEDFQATKITSDLDLTSTRLVVQGVPTTKLTGQLGYRPGAITYALKGDALGGTFDVEGTYPLGKSEPKKPGDKLPGGIVRVEGIRLDRLGRELRIESLQPLRGVLSLTMKYDHESEGPKGQGRLEVREFGWGNERLATTDFMSDIRLTADGMEIPAINGDVAGGTLRGQARIDFEQPRKSFVSFKLENAEAQTLLTPLGWTVERGRISASIRTSIGQQFRGSGLIIGTRLNISGVEIAELRVPLAWHFVPGRAARLNVREATGIVANGRVNSRVEIEWNGMTRVDGRMEFVDVNVGEIAKGFGTSAYGVGKTTGRFDFNGNDVRNSSDLNGSLTATFGQTTVKEFPILGSVSALLTPVQALTRFDSGELTARLGSGLFRIERLALAGSGAKLFSDGTISLEGKLDLDVVYNTGQIGPSAPLIRLVLRDIPAIGPIPVGLIVRVTEALSNRIVRLRIGGTAARPDVRVNTANLLSENAVRFFIGQYVPLTTPNR